MRPEGIKDELKPLESARLYSSDSEAARVLLLGLGNILLSDEGAGVHAVNAIKERYTFSPAVDIVDGGTMGLDLLPFFQERDRILIVDAADFGKAPGAVGTLEGEDIPSVLNAKLSAHHIGVADLLFAAKLLREAPPQVCLVGVQPKSLDVGLEMTEEVGSRIDHIIELAVQKLREWGIVCSPQPVVQERRNTFTTHAFLPSLKPLNQTSPLENQ